MGNIKSVSIKFGFKKEGYEMKYPISFVDNEKVTLLLDTVFAADDCLKYAIEHNTNIKFTDTTSTGSVETIYKFVKEGFTVSFAEEKAYAPDGIELNPRIIVYLNRR